MEQRGFRITLPGFGGADDTRELARYIISVGRPSVEIPRNGPAVWLPIPIKLREPAAGPASQLVNRQLMRQMTRQDDITRASDYKFTLRVEMPHHDGDARETWVAEGCMVTLCEQSGDDDGSVLISMEIQPDLVFTDIG